MKFYNLKTKAHVDVPDSNIQKKKTVRKTKSGGTQTRYALIANHEGNTLYKFVSEADYNKCTGKEIS